MAFIVFSLFGRFLGFHLNRYAHFSTVLDFISKIINCLLGLAPLTIEHWSENGIKSHKFGSFLDAVASEA